ncbi:DUF2513 domain-containing protein [Thalassovita aquimarina]|uniref:DUF2513 domain-containing protein n=1 Tax=Thalassovita aquimarina TaxID=2785917 RepID=A0ABS5HTC3_9RHOB|nr:DUF2513 domain-containing protein [Thalassovita aquimarina]
MKRDDDLIRALLFNYEEADDWLLMMPGYTKDASEEERRERYHVLLLSDEGFVTEVGNGTFRLTAQGHDYINAIRSDDVWEKTKDGAAKIGGATLGIMKDLAVAYIRQEAAEKLGIEL